MVNVDDYSELNLGFDVPLWDHAENVQNSRVWILSPVEREGLRRVLEAAQKQS